MLPLSGSLQYEAQPSKPRPPGPLTPGTAEQGTLGWGQTLRWASRLANESRSHGFIAVVLANQIFIHIHYYRRSRVGSRSTRNM